MKKIITMILIVAVIVGAGILEHRYVEKTFAEFNDKMVEIDQLIKEQDTQTALIKTREMTEWWDKKRNVLEIVSYSQDIRNVSVIIGELEGSLIAGDLQNAQSKSTSMFALIINIKNVLDFNIKDIF